MSTPPLRLFPKRSSWISIPLIFYFGIFALHLGLRFAKQYVDFDMDQYWPVSIFFPKLPTFIDIFPLAGIACLGMSIYHHWQPEKWSIVWVTIIVGVIMISTNTLQGYDQGFVAPEGSQSEGYYHYVQDAQGVGNVSNLLRTYTALQPMLRDHTRVHPPGPLLFSYFTQKIHLPPAVVGTLMWGLSVMLIPFLYYFTRRYLTHESALFTAFVLGLLPGVQIYFFYSIDAVICTLFFATFYFFTHQRTDRNQYLTIALLWLSAFMTFGVMWLVAVLVIYEWWFAKSLAFPMRILLFTAALFLIFYFLTGYNYYSSFKIASSFEGSEGFYALDKPLSYIITRFEDFLDIAMFTSPYVLWIIYHNIKTHREHQLTQIGLVGIGAFALFLVAGAYYTGETGRAAQFLYPFIVVCSVPLLTQISLSQQKIFLMLLIAQTTLMQMFGYYVW